jgi:hypothetical protein
MCLCIPRVVHVGAYKSCETLLLYLWSGYWWLYNGREALSILAEALLFETTGSALGEVWQRPTYEWRRPRAIHKVTQCGTWLLWRPPCERLQQGLVNNVHFLIPVAEPPKLYGPRAPVIISKTSDFCTWKPDNPVVCRVSSGNPKSSIFYNSYRINNGVTTTLQHWYKNFIHRSCGRFTT